jgi:hypothetical protein
LPQERARNHSKNRVKAPTSVPGNPKALRFSFKHLQADHERFQASRCETGFFEAMLETLKYYSSMSVDHFVKEDDLEKRHLIIWENTQVPLGFPLVDPDELGTDSAWQFCLRGKNGKICYAWRLHGFLLEEIFYIVWLDSEHKLIEDKSRKPKHR